MTASDVPVKNRPHNWMHGDSSSPECAAWYGAHKRCAGNEPRYGGRGITVCGRWADYANFLEDMGRKPSPAHSLDRIDNNGNYEPGNCRWATKQEQASNREYVKFLEFNGERLKYREWAERTGINAMALTLRIRSGWSVSRALTEPLRVQVAPHRPDQIKCFAPGCNRRRQFRPLCKTHGLAIGPKLHLPLKLEHRLLLAGSPNRFAELLAEAMPMFGGAV